MKLGAMAIGLVLIGSLGAVTVPARPPGPCRSGTLLDLKTRIQTLPAMTNQHYEEKEKNGKKVTDGYTYSPDRNQTIYVLTVELDDMTYTAETPQNLFFGYNPTDLVVNDPIGVCIDKNKLILIRPNSKEYKMKIVRIERKPKSQVDH